ncbi:MAG: reprolysin-like metallopeptidase [Limisphaerales bacterium]
MSDAAIAESPAADPPVPWLLTAETNRAASLQTQFPVDRSSPGLANPNGIRTGLPGRAGWSRDPGSWRPGDRWRIPTPDGGTGTLRIVDLVTPDDSGSVHVRARFEGDAGSDLRLVFRGDRMAGLFRRGDGSSFIASPARSGTHWIGPPMKAPFLRCGTGDPETRRSLVADALENPVAPDIATHDGSRSTESDRLGNGAQAPSARALAGQGGSASAAHSILDLLLGYTPAAEQGAGGEAGIRALLELAVAEANDAFQRSEVLLRLNLVGCVPVDYTESGDLGTDLARLARAGDGWLDEARTLRESHAADLVCLVTESENSNQFAGMANQLRTLEASAMEQGYSVCLRPYLLGNNTLAHEIGHLLGANHDRDTSPEGGVLPGSYGARFMVDGQPYRTVMAYRPGIQVPHFSNPNVSFLGTPTGTIRVADNAATLNWVAPSMALVREPAGRVAFVESRIATRERQGPVQIRLAIAGNLATPGRVRVRTVDGSARAGLDYDPVDVAVPLATDGILPEVFIPIRDTEPGADSGERRFSVVLAEPGPGWALGPQASVTIRILDDETADGLLLDTSFRAKPGADNVVRAVASIAENNVFAGGGFVAYGGEDRPRLARVAMDGTATPDFRAKIKYDVHAVLPVPDGRLVVGGEFNTVNDVRLNHVAILLPGGALDAGFEFDRGADLAVHALAWGPDDKVVLGGDFTSVQGVAALRVARISQSGAIDTGFDTRNSADGSVLAILVDRASRTVIGGRFGRVEGRARGGVARLLPTGRLDAGFASGSGANGPVLALAETLDGSGYLWVAGEFTRFDARPVGRLARVTGDGVWDGTYRGQGQPGADDAILALLPRADGTLWVAGRFTRFDGLRRNRVARLLADGSVDPAFDPGLGPNDWVMAMAERADGALVLGGVFTEVMGIPRGGLAVLLPAMPPPARIGWGGPTAGGRRWHGNAWPRQTYAVEHSADLEHWIERQRVTASGQGYLTGTVPESNPPGTPAEFLRLKRVVE